jgi:hypothetical protein
LSFLIWAPSQQALAEDWHFNGVGRVVAMSDIHGAHADMIRTLQEADVVDEDRHWSGGTTHLVITGDLLDRGAESRRVMDFVIRLEFEARLAGGRVHQLLGNHEVMNIIGDLRYVSEEEYASYLDLESNVEREFWYRQFRQSMPEDIDEASLRAAFNLKAPPGYFGHRKAFGVNGPYGKWLLEKPFVVVIDGTAFVHGGLPSYVSEQGLAGVNGTLKDDLRNYAVARSTLQGARVLSPIDTFKETPWSLEQALQSGSVGDNLGPTVAEVIELSDSPLHRAAGPTWYRGTATCSALIEGDGLIAALDRIGASRVVIGHTPTITRRVQQRMNGRIIEIDTGILKKSYNGSGNALVIEGVDLSVLNQDGSKGMLPLAHPVRVGHESLALDDTGLEMILKTGEIDILSGHGTSWKLLKVTAQDTTVAAHFKEVSDRSASWPEIAAYRLDRMLGLGMVPVTVHREVNGVLGSLQFVPSDTMTERERVANGDGDRAPCPVHRQMGAMLVFDALIQNSARTPSSILYSVDDWLLVLTNHEGSFGNGIKRPEHIRDTGLVLGGQWRSALEKLDDNQLHENLGDVLGQTRLDALAQRRDALIQAAELQSR